MMVCRAVRFCFALCMAVWLTPYPAAQAPVSIATPFSTQVETDWLHQVLPQAEEFGPKQGDPPAWPGYRYDPLTRSRELVGYAFLTADLPPEEAGYSAPIALLAAVDTTLNLSGVKILDYNETYRRTKGDFLADEDLLRQFRGKPISDEFQIGRDIDGIAGSTVSVFAIARGARNAARRIAEAYLDYDPSDPVQEAREARIVENLSRFSWEDLLDSGILEQLEVPLPAGGNLLLWFTYLGHPGLGAFWIGAQNYALAERGASTHLGGGALLLVAVGGSAAAQFREDQLQVNQGDGRALSWYRRLMDESYIPVGPLDTGVLAGRADFAVAIVLPEAIDVTRPVSLVYRQLGSAERHTLEFQLTGLGLQLARGEDVLSDAEIAQILRAENSRLRQFFANPPWGVTPWGKVASLIAILTLAMIAFLRKNATLRWAVLAITVAYLGFIDSGFLSISQLVNTINQGPAFLFSNLPLLLFIGFTLATTLLWGRIFCSSLCPFGAVQDFITRFTPKRWRREVPQRIHERALTIKYLILALIVVATLVAGQVSIFQYFEPFGTLFFLNGSLILWFILIGFLAACCLVPRFYCRYACPLGAALGVVSLVSPLRIRRVEQCTVCIVCERACPTGAIRREKVDFKECVRCDVCEIKLIEQAGSCRHDMSRIIASSR